MRSLDQQSSLRLQGLVSGHIGDSCCHQQTRTLQHIHITHTQTLTNTPHAPLTVLLSSTEPLKVPYCVLLKSTGTFTLREFISFFSKRQVDQ